MASTLPSPIVLTDDEQKIFKLLRDVEQRYDLETEVRVAGGWVRDKLLGMESSDIDVALYMMLPSEFCNKVTEYLASIGQGTVLATLIASNEDQSKPMEIARMRLYGISVDFVSLRAVDDTGDCHIRKMRFGTPIEDAYLRDLTINSLFYSIANSSVEDFTGRGIKDLMRGKIMTPLPPETTFTDDPLRVLRAIRFGDRFGFSLGKKLKTAAASDIIKDAIAKNIKRERIGHEVDLIISGKDPVKAMVHICDMSLFSAVFIVPPNFGLSSLQELERLCVTNMDAAAKLLDCFTFNDRDRKRILYAALLLPLREITYKDKKSKKIPLVDYIFRNSLVLNLEDAKAVMMIHNAAERFASLIPYLIYGKDINTLEVLWAKEQIDISLTSKLQLYSGLLLDETKRLWRISLLVSTLLYPNALNLAEYTNENIDLSKKKQDFASVEKEIIKLGLEEVALGHLKPLVDGKEIMSALRLKSTSPVVGEWQRKVRQWQLVHPKATKEKCLEWIEENHSTRVKSKD